MIKKISDHSKRHLQDIDRIHLYFFFIKGVFLVAVCVVFAFIIKFFTCLSCKRRKRSCLFIPYPLHNHVDDHCGGFGNCDDRVGHVDASTTKHNGVPTHHLCKEFKRDHTQFVYIVDVEYTGVGRIR